jgi:hypothetical protein
MKGYAKIIAKGIKTHWIICYKLTNFNQTWYKSSLERELSLNEWPCPLQRGNNYCTKMQK